MTTEQQYRRALSPDAAHLLAELASAPFPGWCPLADLQPRWRRMIPALGEIGAIEQRKGWVTATAAGRQLLERYQRDLAEADEHTDTDILDSPIWRWGALFLTFVTGLGAGFMLRGGA